MHWAWNIVPFAAGAGCLDQMHRGDYVGAVILLAFLPYWCWAWRQDTKEPQDG